METKLTMKENYFRVITGQEPEWLPNYSNMGSAPWYDKFLTPQSVKEGAVVTPLGVKYIGAGKELGYGATVAPDSPLMPDILEWKDFLKIPDYSDYDFRSYYEKQMEPIDRSQRFVSINCADYWLTLVSLLGFENTVIAMCEEPEAVHELLDYVSEYYLFIMEKQLQYVRPDVASIMDDMASSQQPFYSLDMYHEFFEPLQKKHYELAASYGVKYFARHCCGKCDQEVPFWYAMGMRVWNPAQAMNDFDKILAECPELTIQGGYDTIAAMHIEDEEEYRHQLTEYTDYFAPRGRFIWRGEGALFPEGDELAARNLKIAQDFYESYVRDYYKNH